MSLRAADVTLGSDARAAAERFGIPERRVRLARARPTQIRPGYEQLLVVGYAGDGRHIEMRCAIDEPELVVNLRLT